MLFPSLGLAYSSEVILGGSTIGIDIKSDGVMIIGFYKVKGKYPKSDLKEGDIIIKINDISISTISDLTNAIEKNINDNDEVKITYLRDNKEKETTLTLVKEKNMFKTGLYVKDSITGIGTLTFIDPETKKFGALGHEIQEQTTGKVLEIKDGKIFDSKVTGIIPSSDGNPGEKKAEYNANEVKGLVNENTTQGIFGNYTRQLPDKKTYKVAKDNGIKLGEAKIQTVLSGNEIKEYKIKITKINKEKQKNKNFIFEITDESLLDKTNGIIQGMSGSQIIQGDYIIGAVVNNPHKGYGIFITNMLEEAEN